VHFPELNNGMVMTMETTISRYADPAERSPVMRLFYRDWHPTRLGRWANRVQGWLSGLGLPPRIVATLEVRGRTSGRRRSNPVVVTTVDEKRYLVSMLGPGSDWVKNVEAADGNAVLRQGRRHPIHLTPVPPEQRAPILREYVRVAPSGRQHFPLPVGAPLAEFAAIAEHYPVFRIDLRGGTR
jgi:deazaflavin-dependent oxidoreductase (nitroreductase family)